MNPGPYSAYLMIGVVIGLTALKDMSNKAVITIIPYVTLFDKIKKRIPATFNDFFLTITWKHFVAGTVIIMAMMLPATLSRAAFLGVAVVILFIYRDEYWKYRYILWGTIALVGIAFYFFKQGSADGRLLIWKSAFATWIDTPWLGVGIGGFLHAVAEGIAQLSSTNTDFSSAGVADYAYNVLLKIVIEQGLLGGVMAVSFAITALIRLYYNSKPLFYGMVSLLVFSMFSYPFDLLPYKVIAILIVAWSESFEGKRMYEIGKIKVLLFSSFLGFASWHAGKLAGICFQIEWDSYMPLSFNSFSIEEGYKWQPSVNDYSHFLYVFGKKLREEGRYNESNAIFHQATRCSADPVLYIVMGNNYKDMKHYDLAEQVYYKAFAVMPNRLYPLYQLMLLYKDSGNMKKAKAMARRVIEMKPKIESPATREMKKKAREML